MIGFLLTRSIVFACRIPSTFKMGMVSKSGQRVTGRATAVSAVSEVSDPWSWRYAPHG